MKKEASPSELVFREQMREAPPQILLTNYSMLEYLLLRPHDSPLFDDGRASNWAFIVLDEAHQYRGANGIEMGMLLRRLKQRIREGGRGESIRCPDGVILKDPLTRATRDVRIARSVPSGCGGIGRRARFRV